MKTIICVLYACNGHLTVVILTSLPIIITGQHVVLCCLNTMCKQLNQAWRRFSAWTLHSIKNEIPSAANSAGRAEWPHLSRLCHIGVGSLGCPLPTCHTCSPLTRMSRASPTTGTTTLNLPTFQHHLSSAQIIHEKCTTKAWLFPRMWSTCNHNSSYNLCWPCQGAT